MCCCLENTCAGLINGICLSRSASFSHELLGALPPMWLSHDLPLYNDSYAPLTPSPRLLSFFLTSFLYKKTLRFFFFRKQKVVTALCILCTLSSLPSPLFFWPNLKNKNRETQSAAQGRGWTEAWGEPASPHVKWDCGERKQRDAASCGDWARLDTAVCLCSEKMLFPANVY